MAYALGCTNCTSAPLGDYCGVPVMTADTGVVTTPAPPWLGWIVVIGILYLASSHHGGS